VADININVKGDASSGKAALDSVNGSLGKSVVAWTEVANAAKKAGAMVLDAAKAYAESERITNQLNRVAGEYTGILEDQAKALSRLSAVDDDVIKQSQTLLVQWGGVGAATSKTTKAILDYAAATGTDAVAATQDLIRNVESGGTGMAKLGVHFRETGDKSKDLASLVEALGGKFGGAAGVNANSLSGRIALAEIALDDLRKTFGGFVGAIESKLGILEKLTGAIRGISAGVTNSKGILETLNALTPGSILVNAGLGAAGVLGAEGSLDDSALPSMASGLTNKAMRSNLLNATQASGEMERLQAKNIEAFRKFQDDWDELDEHARERDEKAYVDELELSAKRVELQLKEAAEREKIRGEMMTKIEKENAEHAEKMVKEEKSLEDKAARDSADRAKKKAEEARHVGDAIGAAFVDALSSQLEKLAAGGEFDAALFIGDVLSSVFAVAASAIGTAYGMPALGAAVGNLGATGIRAGFGALSASSRKAARAPQYHDGGWVGAPRYHDGSWVGGDEERAILQHGERVLSRAEVARVGGSQAVDSMARGGRQVSISINALDAKSFAESLEGDGGLGMQRTLRSGRGYLPALLGAGPR